MSDRVKTIRAIIDLASSEINKAEKMKAEIERDIESYNKLLLLIQGLCKHVDEDGKSAVVEIGHSHNDTHYRCQICGKEYSA